MIIDALTLADVQRRVAELPCPACGGKGNQGVPDFERDKRAVTMSVCESCQGSGKVYPLREPCPCLAVAVRDGINHHLDMDGCRTCWKRGDHCPECDSCVGTGWVPVTDFGRLRGAVALKGYTTIRFTSLKQGVRCAIKRGHMSADDYHGEGPAHDEAAWRVALEAVGGGH